MLVAFVSAMHVYWGIMLLIHGGAIGTTATAVLRQLVPAYDERAIIYIVSGLLPLVLLWRPGSVAGLLSVLPQQILLILSGISVIVAISSGNYADGTHRGPAFISMDQGLYIMLAIFYVIESLDRYHERG